MEIIFFDVANTLLHKPGLFNQVVSVLKKHRLDLPVEHLRKTHKWLSEVIEFPARTSRGFYREFNREYLFSLGINPSDGLVEEIFNECKYLPWKAFDDVVALNDLNLPMGIISNWDSSLGEKLKEHVGARFDIVIGSQDFGASKPDPAIYREAIKRSQSAPEKILYIGDSIKLDMNVALEQGMRAVLIDRDDVYPYYPGERIRSLNELQQIIQGSSD